MALVVVQTRLIVRLSSPRILLAPVTILPAMAVPLVLLMIVLLTMTTLITGGVVTVLVVVQTQPTVRLPSRLLLLAPAITLSTTLCTAGTSNDDAIDDDNTYYKWRCDGIKGGANSGTCQIAKSSVIAGACATLIKGTIPSSSNACTAGTYNDSAVADTDVYYQWRCDGSAGGSDSNDCQVAKQYNFTTLVAAGNGAPRGIWSNGTTMWVVDPADDKIYAYTVATKVRDSSKDFNTLSAAGNNNPYGLWSNGTTMWVADISDRKGLMRTP